MVQRTRRDPTLLGIVAKLEEAVYCPVIPDSQVSWITRSDSSLGLSPARAGQA